MKTDSFFRSKSLYRVFSVLNVFTIITVPIKIFILGEHVDDIEFIAALFATYFIIHFWPWCEWKDFLKGD